MDENLDAQYTELRSKRVLIYGLGLIGGSFALAARPWIAQLAAIDPDPQTCQYAIEHGFVDQAAGQAAQLTGMPDIIVLAAPPQVNLHILSQLPDWHSSGAIVLDVSSTKSHIVAAMEGLPTHFDPVGGHPMCGKEHAGIQYASGDLFLEAVFALCRTERTSGKAASLIESMVRAIGAIPLWMNAMEHDRWVAHTSHLPYLLANTLGSITPPEAARLAGPGFRDTSRLATSNLTMMLDILRANRRNILMAMQLYRSSFEALEEALQRDDFQQVEELLRRGADQRTEIWRRRHAP